jgi:ABC-type lipoprotein release transport system permease subunit
MGGLRIIFRLAWRNLWRNHRRTLIMLAAIVIGVWAMIFMTALMRGMVDDMVKDGVSVLPGHVQIHHPAFRDDPTITNVIAPPDGQLLEALNRPEVVAWATRVRVPAVISSERDTRGVTLVGPSASVVSASSPTMSPRGVSWSRGTTAAWSWGESWSRSSRPVSANGS